MSLIVTDKELRELMACSDVSSSDSSISASSNIKGKTINLCGTPKECLMDYFDRKINEPHPATVVIKIH
jgi:hypothetical protein